jgi:hypothetical protein
VNVEPFFRCHLAFDGIESGAVFERKPNFDAQILGGSGNGHGSNVEFFNTPGGLAEVFFGVFQ